MLSIGGIFIRKAEQFKEMERCGKNIARLRKAKKLTQEKAAEQFMMSCRYLQYIEAGKIIGTADILGRIAKKLGVAPATMGVFLWTDEEILEYLHSTPGITGYTGKTLNMFKNIALLRKQYGWTQEKLSKASKVSVATIGSIECACSNISINKLLNIAEAFSVTPVKLAILTTPEKEFMDMVRQARKVAKVKITAA